MGFHQRKITLQKNFGAGPSVYNFPNSVFTLPNHSNAKSLRYQPIIISLSNTTSATTNNNPLSNLTTFKHHFINCFLSFRFLTSKYYKS